MHFIWDAIEPCSMSKSRREFLIMKFCTGLRWKTYTATLLRAQLWWSGHVRRMSDRQHPWRLFYRELNTGKRPRGRPNTKQYKDRALKESLKRWNIPNSTWEETVEDRASWQCPVSSGVAAFEKRRVIGNQEKHQKRKDCASSACQTGLAPSMPFPHCDRLFRA